MNSDIDHFEDYGLLKNAQDIDQWKTEKPKFPDVLGGKITSGQTSSADVNANNNKK